jgi:hypothetical protein
VKNFNFNKQIIEDYDVLNHREDFIKKLRKKYSTKEAFSEELKREMQYRYWSRSEYELVVEITEDERVVLRPWCGCRNPETALIDVTDDKNFDWLSFAKYHIDKQIYKNKAKVDIFSQLTFSDEWSEFVDYCFNYK